MNCNMLKLISWFLNFQAPQFTLTTHFFSNNLRHYIIITKWQTLRIYDTNETILLRQLVSLLSFAGLHETCTMTHVLSVLLRLPYTWCTGRLFIGLYMTLLREKKFVLLNCFLVTSYTIIFSRKVSWYICTRKF